MITLILLGVIVFLYYYGTRTQNYWSDRGVKHDKPVPFWGNNTRNFLLMKSFTQLADEMYWKYPNEKIVGFYRASIPELVIRDPEIAKKILTTDFVHFYARGLTTRLASVEPLLRNLFFVDGDVWRLLRQRLTPAFTSGKLRAMFPLITERAHKLQARAARAAAARLPLDARDLMARYTTDFIGACGFGLDADSLSDDNSAFRQLAAKIFDIGVTEFVVANLKFFFSSIFKYVSTMSRVEKGMKDLVGEVMRRRNYEPAGRHDFIDLLLECKKKGIIVGESLDKVDANGKRQEATLEIDDELLVAQVFVFLAAGFETSSSATSATLNELAHNPKVQDKVQEEIDRVLAKYEGKLCYDAIKEMTYLEWTFKEGMRIFPSLGFLIRECVRKYKFEDLNVTIDAGVRIFIPIQAMQNDPKYFDNPTEFRPERFDPAEFQSYNKLVYMPFGVGPRACIGERLGLMQSLAGLAAVLSRFRVAPAPAAPRRPRVNAASSIVQTVKGGVPLLFTPRDPGTPADS